MTGAAGQRPEGAPGAAGNRTAWMGPARPGREMAADPPSTPPARPRRGGGGSSAPPLGRERPRGRGKGGRAGVQAPPAR